MTADPLHELRVTVGDAELTWPQPRLRAYAEHWGAEAARGWLPEAARGAERLCRRWGVVPLVPARDGVQSLVLHGVTAAGERVVLKVPARTAAGVEEHLALTRWVPGPVPAVRAYDPGTGSLLLQQLEQQAAGYTCRDLVALARRLHLPSPVGAEPAETTCRALLRAASGYHHGRAARRRHEADLRTAEALMLTLLGGSDRVLLHGDLLHKNLVTTPDGLYAIDPQPVAGPAELDLARWVAWGGSDHATGFDDLLHELVSASDGPGPERLDPERLVTWTWAVSVCENKPGRAGEPARVAFLDSHRRTVTGTTLRD